MAIPAAEDLLCSPARPAAARFSRTMTLHNAKELLLRLAMQVRNQSGAASRTSNWRLPPCANMSAK